MSMKAMAAVVMLVGGCTSGAVPAAATPAAEWQSFGTFDMLIRTQQEAAWPAANDACASRSASLPTEDQWKTVQAAGYDGIEYPSVEWFAWDPSFPTYFDPAAEAPHQFVEESPLPSTHVLNFRCTRPHQ